jgi:hypothetical protein
MKESGMKKIFDMILTGEIVFSVESNEKTNETPFDFAPKMVVTTNHVPGAAEFVMSNRFYDWALVYFSPKGGNTNKFLVKEDVMNDFVTASGCRNLTHQKFIRLLQSFCRMQRYGFNNPKNENRKERIIHKHNGKVREMIYVRSF